METRSKSLAIAQAHPGLHAPLEILGREIRHALVDVIGAFDVLAESGLRGEQRLLAETGQGAARRIRRVIDALALFNRLDQNQVSLVSRAEDLRELIHRAVGPYCARAVEAGLSFSIELDAALPAQALVDAERLASVLEELLDNAIRFTVRGAVRLHVVVEDKTESEVRVRFIVEDTGVGFAPERLSREALFNPFSSQEDVLGRPTVRFGLPIASRLAHILGGELEYSARPGEGAKFWFETCLELPAEPIFSRFASPLPGELPRVLVAEDNAWTRKFLERVLRPLSCETRVVVNGSEALRAAEEFAPDLILMDIDMPVLSGIEASKRIRKLPPPWCDVRIVALTANSADADRRLALDAEMDDYIEKPFQVKELRERLREWISGPHTIREPTENFRELAQPSVRLAPDAVMRVQHGNPRASSLLAGLRSGDSPETLDEKTVLDVALLLERGGGKLPEPAAFREFLEELKMALEAILSAEKSCDVEGQRRYLLAVHFAAVRFGATRLAHAAEHLSKRVEREPQLRPSAELAREVEEVEAMLGAFQLLDAENSGLEQAHQSIGV